MSDHLLTKIRTLKRRFVHFLLFKVQTRHLQKVRWLRKCETELTRKILVHLCSKGSTILNVSLAPSWRGQSLLLKPLLHSKCTELQSARSLE